LIALIEFIPPRTQTKYEICELIGKNEIVFDCCKIVVIG